MANEAVVFRGVIAELDFRVPVSFKKARVFDVVFGSPGSDFGPPGDPSKERNWAMTSAFSVVLAMSLVWSFWVS